MGIFIYEDVSVSVTKEEWEKVYEETLILVKAFPLADKGFITYAGKKVVCAVPTKEQIQEHGEIGWCASMDYDTLKWAESYYLPRDLVSDNKVNLDAGDAMMGALPAYMNYDWKEDRFHNTYSLWGAKTQGEPYHMYLLAIACLIEDRLGEKAFVYGDITQGQCQKAVKMANQHLENPIRVPARCEMERLYRRVWKLPLEEKEKVAVFKEFYLGVQDGSFGDFVKAHFSESALLEYWKERFSKSNIGTIGFGKNIKEYLSFGLELEKLCKIVSIKDKEGNAQYEKFIRAVMDSKIHLKEKNTEDYLDIQQNAEQPYSIWTLFAGVVFGSAHNLKVNRYIPIEEVRSALKRGLETGCDVDRWINQYLAEEAAAPEIDALKPDISEKELEKMVHADASEVFSQIMDSKMDALQNQRNQYEISDYEDLINYKKGSIVKPKLAEALGKSFQFYHGMVKEEQYKVLMKQTPEERCVFLIEQNRSILLRDRDWIQIFSDIEEHSEAYERYYPMVRVKLESQGLIQMTMALVLNDELYAYAEELGRMISKNDAIGV